MGVLKRLFSNRSIPGELVVIAGVVFVLEVFTITLVFRSYYSLALQSQLEPGGEVQVLGSVGVLLHVGAGRKV